MSYLPLARKYRPANFQELVGQDGVTKALSNSISIGRMPHAVIFSGIRGIGKTTVARIYAKSLNCEGGPTALPCGQCASCVAITAGNHEDVLEIDGASNTSVDDVRGLRETINYVPQRSKFKVYIIDEVHMLSSSAFNALLKTLEEPPPHVVFVFATTELIKIPQTIVSRCQTFHLQKLPLITIKARLAEILGSEHIPFEDKVIYWVAKSGHGSMRDSLTLLDQVIALGKGEVSIKSLEGIFTNISSEVYLALLMSLVQKNAQESLRLIAQLDGAGIEFADVTDELAKLTRHAFIVRDLGVKALDIALLGLTEEEIKQLAEISALAPAFDLNRLFRSFVQCRSELDGSELDRMVFENYSMEWCLDPGLPSVDDLIASPEPTRKLESLRQGASAAIKQPAPTAATLQVHMPAEAPQPVVATPPKFPGSWRELIDAWKQKKPLQARILEDAYLEEYSPNKIVVSVNENSMAAGKLLQKAMQQKVQETFKELFAFNGTFVAVQKVATAPVSAPSLDTPAAEAPAVAAPVSSESLLETRQREKQERDAELIEKAKNDPFTQEVLRVFDARIEKIVPTT
jgi:DNA polymerase-3 subunit gamma/tau